MRIRTISNYYNNNYSEETIVMKRMDDVYYIENESKLIKIECNNA